MFIVDAQVHIWLPERPDRPWPKNGRAAPHIESGFGAERLLALMNEAGVDRAVLVPPSWEGDRIDYVLDVARRYPERFAVMARIAIDDPAARGTLGAWMRQPGMLGARLTFVHPNEQSWLTNGTTEWFWHEAEQVGMPVMVHAPQCMDELGAIAERHPALRLIIDHMGIYRMKVDDPGFAAAIARTVALARHPNVAVKVSCLPFYSMEAWPFADMTPHVRKVIEAYGPRRAFWGTDLTKMLPRFPYRTCIDHLLGLDFLTDEDKEWVMGRGIAAWLNWPPATG